MGGLQSARAHTHTHGLTVCRELFIALVLQKGVCVWISRKETVSTLAEGIVREKQNVWNVECNRLGLNIPFEELSRQFQGHFFSCLKQTFLTRFHCRGKIERGLLGARICSFCHLILDYGFSWNWALLFVFCCRWNFSRWIVICMSIVLNARLSACRRGECSLKIVDNVVTTCLHSCISCFVGKCKLQNAPK